jgi:tellurite methyltransferase
MYAPKNLSMLEGMDLYLIDQILKGRYIPGQRLLDAGVGGGRNLNWFVNTGFEIHACDIDAVRQSLLAERYPNKGIQWSTCDLARLEYPDNYVDHTFCNAVLHFARNYEHHAKMLSELYRVTKPMGTMFIRSCSNIGLPTYIDLGHGHYRLPDESERYLLTAEIIEEFRTQHGLEYLEPIRSVNVSNQRVMTTLMLLKLP